MTVEPALDYIHGRVIEMDRGVVASQDIRDTEQYFEVLAVGPGRVNEHGTLIKSTVKPGDKVIIQKHAAEGDTPLELLNKGEALFMASRIMAHFKEV